MTDYGNIDVEEFFTGDPVEDWLDLKRREEIAPGTIKGLEQRLWWNADGTALQQFLAKRDVDVLDATVNDLFDYRDHIREVNKDREVKNKLSEISTFYQEMRSFKQTDSNPAAFVLSRTKISAESPDREHHTVEEIGNYLAAIPHPQMQTMGLTYLKYGLRRGAVVNIDLCCVNIDDPRFKTYLAEHDVVMHEKVQRSPDSIYVYGNFSKNDVIAGEKRRAGNKRENEAVLPIDDELKYSLLQFLTVRPHTESPHPLFPQLSPVGGHYERIPPSTVYSYLIDNIAIEYGITERSNSRSDVDIHYFRHFFRTQMKLHYGDHDGHLHDELIKYIRGDKMADKILEIYTHDWDVNVRETYLDNIYKFGLFD